MQAVDTLIFFNFDILLNLCNYLYPMRFAFLLLLVVWFVQTSKSPGYTPADRFGVLIPAEVVEIKSGEIYFTKTEDPDKRWYILAHRR